MSLLKSLWPRLRSRWSPRGAKGEEPRGANERGLPKTWGAWTGGDLLQDVRYAGRMLRKHPGVTTVVGLTLAGCIGACTTLFTVVNRVLLRPLPFEHPEQLVQLWEGPPGTEIRASGPTFADWRQADTVLECAAAYSPTALNLTDRSTPERLRGLRVSARYLDVFRLQPLLGRGFRPEDDRPGAARVVVLAYGLWQRDFGGAADVVGRTIRLGGEPRTVIGILPAEPVLLVEHEFLVPLVLESDPMAASANNHWLSVVARLRPGVSLAQARSALSAAMAVRAATRLATPAEPRVSAVPLDVQLTGSSRPKLWILMGAVGCLPLIAVANIAGLLLARAAARQPEIAVRLALGASRARIVRQLLTESLLLALLGGALGTLLAFWGVTAWARAFATDLPRAAEIAPDLRALLFALATTLAAGVGFGLAPARQTARLNPRLAIAPSTGASRGTTGRGLRGGLIVAQFAVAMVLLSGAGLLLRSLWQLTSTSPGFEAKHLLAMSVSLDGTRYPESEGRLRFWDELGRRLDALPGVEAVGMAGGLPLNEWNNTTLTLGTLAEGQEPGGGGMSASVDYEYVGGDYFGALRIPILRGRAFDRRDNSPRATRTAILSVALARRAFPDRDAVGQHVTVFNARWQVVGVAGEVRRHGIDQGAWDCVYLPQAYSGVGSRRILARTAGPPLALVNSIRREILALDPNQPVSNLRALDQVVSHSFADRRLMLMLIGAFAGAALFLAALGLDGLMAAWVGQRTREIGIRMALGALRSQVVLLVVRQGMALALLGVGFGWVGALAATRLLGSVLYEVKPTDALAFVGGATLLLLVALLACWLPARRAAMVDLVKSLRQE